MYLEISSRRCGKSERLLENINNNINNSIFVFSIHTMASKDIQHKFYEKYNNRNNVIFDTISSINNYERKINDTSRIYIDEFDFNTENKNLIRFLFYRIPVSVLHNGYYVTTPRSQRSLNELFNYATEDILIKLLQYNNFGYESNWITDKQIIVSMKNGLLYDEELISTEIEGRFLKNIMRK